MREPKLNIGCDCVCSDFTVHAVITPMAPFHTFKLYCTKYCECICTFFTTPAPNASALCIVFIWLIVKCVLTEANNVPQKWWIQCEFNMSFILHKIFVRLTFSFDLGTYLPLWRQVLEMFLQIYYSCSGGEFFFNQPISLGYSYWLLLVYFSVDCNFNYGGVLGTFLATERKTLWVLTVNTFYPKNGSILIECLQLF